MLDSLKTRQDIIEYVYAKLKAQGKRSVRTGTIHDMGGFSGQEYGSCQYRYGECRCALGWVIPDEHYQPWFEGNGALTICEELETVSPIFADYAFMLNLQAAHDQCDDDHFLSSLREKFYHLAQLWGLNLKFLA